MLSLRLAPFLTGEGRPGGYVLYGPGAGFVSRATRSAVPQGELSVLLLRVWAGSVGFLSGPHEASATGWAFLGPSVGEEATGSLGRWPNPGPWSRAGAADSRPAVCRALPAA